MILRSLVGSVGEKEGWENVADGSMDNAVAPVATPMVAFKNLRRPELVAIIWMVCTSKLERKIRMETPMGKFNRPLGQFTLAIKRRLAQQVVYGISRQ
jgi:hypothetical protein